MQDKYIQGVLKLSSTKWMLILSDFPVFSVWLGSKNQY